MKKSTLILSTLMSVLATGVVLDVNANVVAPEEASYNVASQSGGGKGDRGRSRSEHSRGEKNFDRDTQEYYEDEHPRKHHRHDRDEDERYDEYDD